MLGDERKVQAVLEDLDTAPIPEAERVLFRFLEKVNRESERIQQEDVDAVKAAGWSDEALYDAITVSCALEREFQEHSGGTSTVRGRPALVAAKGGALSSSGPGSAPA